MVDNPHTAAAIAQVVLYVPMVPVTFYLMIRNWKWRPRTAWYPPSAFSAIRLVGGIMTIIEQQDPKHENRGLLIATIVLLNVGLVPLLMAYLGYARLVLENDFSHSRPISIFLRLLKVGVLLATGLLGAAGGYAGKPEDAEKQSTLSKAAYAIFVVVLVALIGTFVALAGNLKSVARGRRYYIPWALVAAVPLCVRAAYGIIGVAVASGTGILTSSWSPLFGSATAFGLMGLLPEYIVLGIYVYLSIYHLRTATARAVEGEDGKQRVGEMI